MQTRQHFVNLGVALRFTYLVAVHTETDYQAMLPAGEAVRGNVASAGGSLTVEVKGSSIRGKAEYAIAAKFARWVKTMCRQCGT